MGCEVCPKIEFNSLCIPLDGNILFRGNLVCILFIFSVRVGIFWVNFATVIHVSKENFWYYHISNLKHLLMRKFQLLLNTCYFQFLDKIWIWNLHWRNILNIVNDFINNLKCILVWKLDFQYRNVEMFLLKLWSKLHNWVKQY